jgi:hypothetical protein
VAETHESSTAASVLSTGLYEWIRVTGLGGSRKNGIVVGSMRKYSDKVLICL